MKKLFPAGFTLIELLIVVAIIAIISTFAVVQIKGASAKARDAVRLKDMETIVRALKTYRETYGKYPDNSDFDDGCSVWDVGYTNAGGQPDKFIEPLKTSGILTKVPGDPKGPIPASIFCTLPQSLYHYRYLKYNAGGAGCAPALGPYFILGVIKMETVTMRPHPSSPGFQCGSIGSFDWVIGGFEK